MSGLSMRTAEPGIALNASELACFHRVGFDQTLGLSQYGNKVKRIRRLLHDAMSPKFMQVRCSSETPGNG